MTYNEYIQQNDEDGHSRGSSDDEEEVEEDSENDAEVRSSRRADWGLKYILKAKYKCWVSCNENKVLKLCYNSVFCPVDVRLSAVYFANAPFQLV